MEAKIFSTTFGCLHSVENWDFVPRSRTVQLSEFWMLEPEQAFGRLNMVR
jgi:hypothetical protein